MSQRHFSTEHYLTAEEVAERFQVKVSTIYRWARLGHMPSSRIGRKILFKPGDIELFIRYSRVDVGKEPNKPWPPDWEQS